MSPRAISQPVKIRGKVIGTWLGQTVTKKVERRKHFMWKLKSWGFDCDLVQALASKGCRRIVLKIKDENDVLSTDFQSLIDHGVEGDYGHGRQRFLRECYFEKSSDAGQRKLPL